MTRSQKLTLALLIVVVCVLLFVLLDTASQVYQGWRRLPLGPTMVSPSQETSTGGWTASPNVAPPASPTVPTEISITITPASPFLACRDLPVMTILVIGTDSRSSEYRTGRADVMRILRVDFRAQRLTALEFPRDLWVEIPGIEHNLKTDHQKLNTAYTYGNPEDGPGLLARTLDLNFGMQVDHYIVVNMNVFVEVVDSLGGLDVTIPAGGIDGRTQIDRSARLVFPEGLQHLTGEQALTLARIRNVSVFERAEHQNLVACALQDEVRSPETILQVPAIINAFLDNIRTDLSPDQISQLACLGTQMPRSNIVFASFPLRLFKSADTYDPVLKRDVFIWKVDFPTLRGYVAEFQAGNWPAPSAPGAPADEASSCN